MEARIRGFVSRHRTDEVPNLDVGHVIENDDGTKFVFDLLNVIRRKFHGIGFLCDLETDFPYYECSVSWLDERGFFTLIKCEDRIRRYWSDRTRKFFPYHVHWIGKSIPKALDLACSSRLRLVIIERDGTQVYEAYGFIDLPSIRVVVQGHEIIGISYISDY